MNYNILLATWMIGTSMYAAYGKIVDEKTATRGEYEQILTQMLAASTKEQISKIAIQNRFWTVATRKDLLEFRLEADRKLATRGYGQFWTKIQTWPKVSELARRENGADKAYTNTIAYVRQYGSHRINLLDLAVKGASIDELIICLNELIAAPQKCYVSTEEFNAAKKGIQRSAVLGIKKALRKQGKSFVTVDGVNPCEVYMEKLNKALNAPRLEGLNQWLEELGFVNRVDVSSLPSGGEINTLKGAIFYGERKMTPYDRTMLSLCLGVDGFNEFVKLYNGD